MHFVESRLLEIERILRDLQRSNAELAARVAALEQRQALQGGGGGGGGGGSSGAYYDCTLTAALNAGSSVSSQEVFRRDGTSRSSVTTDGTIYNDGPNAADNIAVGNAVILAANPDGSYTAIGVYC